MNQIQHGLTIPCPWLASTWQNHWFNLWRFQYLLIKRAKSEIWTLAERYSTYNSVRYGIALIQFHGFPKYVDIISFQPLRSVAVDHAEESCYVGSQEGKIYRIDLLDPPRGVEQMVDETASRKMFVGHEKAVTCLSVSMDGCHLLSGEENKSRETRSRRLYVW